MLRHLFRILVVSWCLHALVGCVAALLQAPRPPIPVPRPPPVEVPR